MNDRSARSAVPALRSGPTAPLQALPRTLFLAAALACATTSAGAQEPGLYLRWNDCVGGPTSSTSATLVCGTQSGQEDLVPAFSLATVVDSVIAVEIVIDVQFDAATVPAWWRFDPSGCRFGRVQPTTLPPTLPTACENFWNADFAEGFLFLVGQPRGAPSQARMVVSYALPDIKEARRLEANTMYFAAKLMILNTNPTNCAGCATPACLVLNSIRLGRVPDAAGGDVTLDVSGPADANRATWQGSTANCAAVPARSSTWGRLKGLYR